MTSRILLMNALAITFVGFGSILNGLHCHLLDKRVTDLEKRVTICEEKIASMNASKL